MTDQETTTDAQPQGFIPVPPEFDAQAAAMLAEWAPFHGFAGGAAMLEAFRADDHAEINGVTLNDQLVVLIITRRVHLMNEVVALTVIPGFRGHGIGELALADAVRRAGKRPLVVECPESMRPYFVKRGFKMVGKRKGADGEPRYRLGAHAPRPAPAAETEESSS
jgi:GNAT superfamily N-acetyltransferase